MQNAPQKAHRIRRAPDRDRRMPDQTAGLVQRRGAGPREVYGYDLTPSKDAPSADQPPADDGDDDDEPRSGGKFASMFVPDAALVPAEYWSFRSLTTLLGLISTVKGALTAQAHMIAIGVGDGNATPLNYLVISEINAAVGRFVGLALASWVSSSYFAMHAKRTMVFNATVGKLGSIFAVLLLLYPA